MLKLEKNAEFYKNKIIFIFLIYLKYLNFFNYYIKYFNIFKKIKKIKIKSFLKFFIIRFYANLIDSSSVSSSLDEISKNELFSLEVNFFYLFRSFLNKKIVSSSFNNWNLIKFFSKISRPIVLKTKEKDLMRVKKKFKKFKFSIYSFFKIKKEFKYLIKKKFFYYNLSKTNYIHFLNRYLFFSDFKFDKKFWLIIKIAEKRRKTEKKAGQVIKFTKSKFLNQNYTGLFGYRILHFYKTFFYSWKLKSLEIKNLQWKKTNFKLKRMKRKRKMQSRLLFWPKSRINFISLKNKKKFKKNKTIFKNINIKNFSRLKKNYLFLNKNEKVVLLDNIYVRFKNKNKEKQYFSRIIKYNLSYKLKKNKNIFYYIKYNFFLNNKNKKYLKKLNFNNFFKFYDSRFNNRLRLVSYSKYKKTVLNIKKIFYFYVKYIKNFYFLDFIVNFFLFISKKKFIIKKKFYKIHNLSLNDLKEKKFLFLQRYKKNFKISLTNGLGQVKFVINSSIILGEEMRLAYGDHTINNIFFLEFLEKLKKFDVTVIDKIFFYKQRLKKKKISNWFLRSLINYLNLNSSISVSYVEKKLNFSHGRKLYEFKVSRKKRKKRRRRKIRNFKF